MNENIAKNQAQNRALARTIQVCIEKYPEASFYEILKNLGLIDSPGVNYNDTTSIII